MRAIDALLRFMLQEYRLAERLATMEGGPRPRLAPAARRV